MIYLIAILIYLFTLTGVGIYKAQQVRTKADFSVAGRSLSPWILVCTMLAAWIGTGSIVGNAGKPSKSVPLISIMMRSKNTTTSAESESRTMC